MKTTTAKDFRDHFGLIMDEIEREAVLITKNGRNKAVLMPFDEFERLEKLEAQYWSKKAQEDETEGYIGVAQTKRLFSKVLSRGA